MTPHWHARALARSDWRAPDLRALFNRCSAGDAEARETIIVRFLPFARRLARGYEGRGEPLEDLVQAASVGLIKAVDRYSPDRGDPFLAYARPVILGELRRHFRDKTWRMHVSRAMKERAGRVLRADAELRAAWGSAKPEVIAKSLGIAPEEVAEARRALEAYRPTSLDATYMAGDGDSIALGELIGVRDAEYEHVEVSVGMRQALLTLKPRDRRILLMRVACELTQDEIARHIGLSQMQVSRILRKAGAAVSISCGLAATA